MSKIMAVNSGSSTLKWKLYTVPDEKVIAKGMVDRLGLSDSVFEVEYGGKKISEMGDIPDHTTAVNKMLDKLIELQIIKSYHEIDGVGHRVVAGGSIFKDSALVTPRVVQQLRIYLNLLHYIILDKLPESMHSKRFCQMFLK
jgi:Acetate kinase